METEDYCAVKMNPYTELGLEVTATRAEIKKQYRAKSKALHPDIVKDDGTAFRRLKLCYDTLLDEESRDYFNLHGTIKGYIDPESDSYAAICSQVVNLLLQIILSENNVSLDLHNIVELAKAQTELKIEEGLTAKRDLNVKIGDLTKAISKLTSKDGNNSLLIVMMKSKLEELGTNNEKFDKQIEIFRSMNLILDNHTYQVTDLENFSSFGMSYQVFK